jgi:octanoyl-[GcvH]:protein N-octanoyltransferase
LRIEDATLHPSSLAEALARDETAGRDAPEARLYVVRPALALGPRDRRLPRYAEAVRALTNKGVDVVERASGGLAVGLTEGVLNLTLAWPGSLAPATDEAFDHLSQVLTELLLRYGLRARRGEVAHGFCPGPSDLAVSGRKIAGLAQRRRRQSVYVHAFLWVADPSPVPLVQEFYRLAGSPWLPEAFAMTSLSAAVGRPVTLAEVRAHLRDILTATSQSLSVPPKPRGGTRAPGDPTNEIRQEAEVRCDAT